jgi:hypothetical protein
MCRLTPLGGPEALWICGPAKKGACAQAPQGQQQTQQEAAYDVLQSADIFTRYGHRKGLWLHRIAEPEASSFARPPLGDRRINCGQESSGGRPRGFFACRIVGLIEGPPDLLSGHLTEGQHPSFGRTAAIARRSTLSAASLFKSRIRSRIFHFGVMP